jgi:hypothetical protein
LKEQRAVVFVVFFLLLLVNKTKKILKNHRAQRPPQANLTPGSHCKKQIKLFLNAVFFHCEKVQAK